MAKKNTPAEVAAVPATYVPSLKTVYKDEIVPKLMKEFGYSTVMQCPLWGSSAVGGERAERGKRHTLTVRQPTAKQQFEGSTE